MIVTIKFVYINMKARIKETGEIIEITSSGHDITGNKVFYDKNGIVYTPSELLFFDSTTDWQQVRIQAAIATMQGIYANCNKQFIDMEIDRVAELAVMQADVLVVELKKKGGQK